jgi:hypothetical protein
MDSGVEVRHADQADAADQAVGEHEAAEAGGRAMILEPNQPRREGVGEPRSYDCPRAGVCRWQEIATAQGRTLCPPRDALARGMDPRVTLF